MGLFHKRLRELKDSHNMTQAEIAEALGISPQTLSYYFNGREPNYDLLINISNLFNVSTDYLLGKSNFKNFESELQYKNLLGNEQITKSFTNSENILISINENILSILNDLSKQSNNPYAKHALMAFNQVLVMIKYIKTTLIESPADMEEYISILKELNKTSLTFSDLENIHINQKQIDACKRLLNLFINLYVSTIYDFDKMKLKEEV